MTYDPERHHRRSVRLQGYDYSSPGAYFVTICAQGRECHFGQITEGRFEEGPFGVPVAQWWLALPERFPAVELDAWVLMPNHFHGILVFPGGTSATFPSLGKVIAYFKYQSTKQINQLRRTPGKRIWQRSFHEHVIRGELTLERLRDYVMNNPLSWELDQLHPANLGKTEPPLSPHTVPRRLGEGEHVNR
jgi:putative transposase